MRHLLAGCALFALSGCISTDPHRLSIVMQADPATAQVGDTVSFYVSVQSTVLTEIEIHYGDGAMQEQPFPGANSAEWTFRHVYTQAGTFQVNATAIDATAGLASASLSVSIQ